MCPNSYFDANFILKKIPKLAIFRIVDRMGTKYTWVLAHFLAKPTLS